jgi:putative drug exporter of the RND superfamily
MAEERPRSNERGPLGRIAALTSKHPRRAIVGWLLAMCVLGYLGTGLEDKISRKPIYDEGSAAERAHDLSVQKFGGEDAMVLMLRGPEKAVDRQGRALVNRLQGLPHTLAISPWSSSGSLKGLRPSPGVAAILVSVGHPQGSNPDTVSEVQHQIDATVTRPVRVSLAGGPPIIDSILAAVNKAGEAGELLAVPVLLFVLLLVCRSILAAIMPLVAGGLVVAATKGALAVIASSIAIDSSAIGIASMFGLALGVDYSLLVVSRFREERLSGLGVEEAVEATILATGKSIVPAGLGLVLAMLVSKEVIPGSFITSLTLAVSIAAILSLFTALIATPATLVLIGSRLDRWALPRRRAGGSFAMVWSNRLSRRPVYALAMVFVLMLCGAWAFTLNTNTGAASQLPGGNSARLQQEDIERQLGPGWTAPYEIVMDGGEAPVTTRRRLDALADFQRKVERDPGVEAMAGFAGLESATKALGSAEGSLAKQERGLDKLGRGLAGVHKGTVGNTEGLARAAGGAQQLTSAIGQTRAGSGQLANGLQSTTKGSTRLSGGLDQASEGSGKLAGATTKASTGAGRLAEKAAQAQKQAAEAVGGTRTLKSALRSGEETLATAPLPTTEEQLAAAFQALQRMTAGRSDPQYAAALEAVRIANRELTGTEPGEEGEPSSGIAVSVKRALSQFNLGLYLAAQQDKNGRKASKGIGKLAKASARLDHGLRRLRASTYKLSGGIAQLSRGGEKLPPGLQQLTSGAERLLSGLGQVESGAGGLAGGLDSGAQRSQRLSGAVGRLHAGIEENGEQSGLLAKSPHLFKSGYFYLAGFDGSPPEQRNQAGFLVNLSQGGSAARMLVVPKDALATAGAAATGERLSADAEELAQRTGTEVFVGGLSPNEVGLNKTLRAQGPIARLILSIVTLIILIPVTRSLVLPIIAALLNLLTVSATFGLLSLFFNGSLLGGPGYVDTSVIPAAIILTFGLAIDYEVFIFARIREEYVRTGSTSEAISNGLSNTAHVISGAAVIMIGVFLAFSVSPLVALRNMGVSQAVGVFIDAFVVRFVILPATMRTLGDRCWWIPRWLARMLPGRDPVPAATLTPAEA